MADDKNSFVVYTGIKEVLDALTDDQVAQLFRGMVDYQISGEAPDFSGTLKLAFIPIRQQMDRDNNKWQQIKQKRTASGRKGGLRSGEVRRETVENEANEANASQTKQNEANEAVNVNVDVNVNGDVDVNVSDSFGAVSDDVSSLSSSLIEYLNQKTGGKYKSTEEVNVLLSEGYTEADIKTVIDKKADEWLDDPKMRGYLRPRTLFGSKFAEYLAAPVPVRIEEQQNQERIVEQLKQERIEKAGALKAIKDGIEEIRGKPGGVKAAWDEYRTLSDQRAVIEQSIEIIDKKLGAMA